MIDRTAVGWPIEFLQLTEIRQRYGDNGIDGFVAVGPNGQVKITDDTQM